MSEGASYYIYTVSCQLNMKNILLVTFCLLILVLNVVGTPVTGKVRRFYVYVCIVSRGNPIANC